MRAAEMQSLRAQLNDRKAELNDRLSRITANVRRGYDADSKERAKEMEDNEVVDALGNETRRELAMISHTLQRIDSGDFGRCEECGEEIGDERLRAHPYATVCIDCASFAEQHRRPV